MKSILAIPLLLGSCLILSAAEPPHRVKIREIRTEIQETPRFEVAGVKDKPFDPRYWLEIEAELEVETKAPDGFIPELRSNWFAIVLPKGEPKVKMLTGEVTFRNVRTKGGTAYISAYIGPDTLEKLTGADRPREGDIEAVALTVSGPNIINEGPHKAGLEAATAKEDTRWWTQGTYKTVPEAIVAKSQTPFAPLWSDRYPAEKEE